MLKLTTSYVPIPLEDHLSSDPNAAFAALIAHQAFYSRRLATIYLCSLAGLVILGLAAQFSLSFSRRVRDMVLSDRGTTEPCGNLASILELVEDGSSLRSLISDSTSTPTLHRTVPTSRHTTNKASGCRHYCLFSQPMSSCVFTKLIGTDLTIHDCNYSSGPPQSQFPTSCHSRSWQQSVSP